MLIVTAFFFHEGVWLYGIFVSRRNVKERDAYVLWKSSRIRPIRWRFRNSWSVSNFVCHMHYIFSQHSNVQYRSHQFALLFMLHCCHLVVRLADRIPYIDHSIFTFVHAPKHDVVLGLGIGLEKGFKEIDQNCPYSLVMFPSRELLL